MSYLIVTGHRHRLLKINNNNSIYKAHFPKWRLDQCTLQETRGIGIDAMLQMWAPWLGKPTSTQMHSEHCSELSGVWAGSKEDQQKESYKSLDNTNADIRCLVKATEMRCLNATDPTHVRINPTLHKIMMNISIWSIWPDWNLIKSCKHNLKHEMHFNEWDNRKIMIKMIALSVVKFQVSPFLYTCMWMYAYTRSKCV